MYFKMAFNNVKKSFKDYTIYFLTLTFAVCIFYSFNSINGQTIMADLNKGQTQYIDIMNKFMSILSIGVSVILGALVIYATNFLIKRRKKEFGIYMTLGMRKRTMSIILFLETLYIGIMSLIIGLVLGLIIAQILSIFTAKLFVLEMSKYSFVICNEAIVKTILYFAIMYLIVMIFNVFVVSRYKLIDLLSAGRKNENVKVRNIYVSSIILFLSFIILGIAYRCIKISSLDFTMIEFKIAIICGIIGTLFFFFGISSVLFGILQKKSNTYLNNLNSFSIRQISSKFNTNFISMTVICLMLLVTIGTLSCGLSIKDSLEETLKESTYFDATFAIEKASDKSEISVPEIEEALKEEGYILGDDEDYINIKTYTNRNVSTSDILRKYVENKDNATLNEFLEIPKMKEQTNMIPISEYNKLRKFKNEEIVDLEDNEVLIASNYEPLKDTLNEFLENEDEIVISKNNYKIKNKEIVTEYLYTSPNATTLFSIIVPDNLVVGDNIEVDENIININFKGTEEEKKIAEEKITSRFYEQMYSNDEVMDEGNEKGYFIYGITRQVCYDVGRGLSTLVIFIAVYLGIVFLLSSAAVLALQQLSSCSESLERYRALKKIGATKKMINKSILIQVCTFFILPLILAIVHSYVGINAVNSYLITLGSSNKLNSILITATIIIIVYGGYLYGTYISYKNVIDNEFN